MSNFDLDGFVSESKSGESMRDKAFNKFAELLIDRIKEISKSKKQWECPWFKSTGIMPQNIDGVEYNGINIFSLLLYTEKKEYKSPIYVTFDRLKSMNYKEKKPITDKEGNKLPYVTIKKGEKSFPVFKFFFNVVNKSTKAKISFDEYKVLEDDEKTLYKVFPNLVTHLVFNIDQTNLSETRPELYKKLIDKNKITYNDKDGYHNEVLDKMFESQSWVCPINIKESDSAFYSPAKDSITIPLYKQFKKGESFYSTALHEMAHSTGHDDRLNREIKNGFRSKEYGREELVAEMTAAIVCNSLGIRNGVKEESVQYLNGWVKNIGEDPKFIETVLFDVKNAYNFIKVEIEDFKSKADNKKNSKKSKRA